MLNHKWGTFLLILFKMLHQAQKFLLAERKNNYENYESQSRVTVASDSRENGKGYNNSQ
jgi:hypothetical protein